MNRTISVRTKELPDTLREALRQIGYSGQDVPVEVTTEVSPYSPAGEGSRGFSAVVELSTGRSKVHHGNWGGGSPATQAQVDVDDRESPLLPGFAIIKGSTGNRTFATIYLNPENVAKYLPAPVSLTDRELGILAQFRALSSAGRKDEWQRFPASKPSDEEIDSLVAKGLLSKNKAGAVSLTTDGKNAARDARLPS
jgi:hypothetical protein